MYILVDNTFNLIVSSGSTKRECILKILHINIEIIALKDGTKTQQVKINKRLLQHTYSKQFTIDEIISDIIKCNYWTKVLPYTLYKKDI